MECAFECVLGSVALLKVRELEGVRSMHHYRNSSKHKKTLINLILFRGIFKFVLRFSKYEISAELSQDAQVGVLNCQD